MMDRCCKHYYMVSVENRMNLVVNIQFAIRKDLHQKANWFAPVIVRWHIRNERLLRKVIIGPQLFFARARAFQKF